jgi:hypothetical protein
MSGYTKEQAREAAGELLDIKQELEALLVRAGEAIRDFPDADYDERTWIANIRIALDRDHGYLAGAERTLQDAIDELEEYEEGPSITEFWKSLPQLPEFDVGPLLENPFDEAA